MIFFIIAGVVLSCLHQSSLGTLMVLAPSKMHPLWYTPVLPLLFLLSAMAVGFPMVIAESLYASWSLGLHPELDMLRPSCPAGHDSAGHLSRGEDWRPGDPRRLWIPPDLMERSRFSDRSVRRRDRSTCSFRHDR